MVTNTHGRELAYGGLVMQWFGRTSETFGYSAKMLIGGGEAESTEGVPVVVDRAGHVVTQPVRVHQDFFVFEPEVNGIVRFNRHLRLTGGVGYRFTGHYYGYGYYGVAVSRPHQPRRLDRYDRPADRQRKLAPFPVIMRATRAWPS